MSGCSWVSPRLAPTTHSGMAHHKSLSRDTDIWCSTINLILVDRKSLSSNTLLDSNLPSKHPAHLKLCVQINVAFIKHLNLKSQHHHLQRCSNCSGECVVPTENIALFLILPSDSSIPKHCYIVILIRKDIFNLFNPWIVGKCCQNMKWWSSSVIFFS